MTEGPEAVDERTTEQSYIQALTLSIDPAWRRLDRRQRAVDADEFAAAHRGSTDDGVTSYAYSTVALQARSEVLLWRMGPTIESLECAGARLLTAGVGRWATVEQSFIGRIGPSQYVRKPTSQEQSLFEGERSRYLIVYPFTKNAEWYLLGRETRQGIMNEHMRVGRDYAGVRQLLAYSFGLDDQDFVVAYETDDLVEFGDLVRALRGTESRRSTVTDTPILLGVHRSVDAILRLLGA